MLMKNTWNHIVGWSNRRRRWTLVARNDSQKSQAWLQYIMQRITPLNCQDFEAYMHMWPIVYVIYTYIFIPLASIFINTLRPRQNGRPSSAAETWSENTDTNKMLMHIEKWTVADDLRSTMVATLCIFLCENVIIELYSEAHRDIEIWFPQN